MHAVVLEKFGGDLTLAEVDKPVAGRGEVLVRVAASGVNPLDTKIRAGTAAHARPVLPAILGLDLAGVVEQAGPGVHGFAAGDEVYGLTGGVGGLPGSLAEYAAVDSALLARKPASLSMREAAALPLAVITAWEGLVDRARVRRGQRVLVHGGAGGVGHVAPVAEYVAAHTDGEGFDVIFDSVGGTTLDRSFEAVRAYTGHVVSALGWGTHSLAPLSLRGATYSGVFTLLPMLTGRGRAHHGEILRKAAALADAGALRPLVDARRFTPWTVADAHQAVEDGTAASKVVVDISE